MRLMARFVTLGVVAFLFATPLMACVMEASQMSVSEAECCKAMAGDCHNSVGPASHKCCRSVAIVPDAIRPVRATSVAPQMHAAVAAPMITPLLVSSTFATLVADTSPPGSPPVCSSILRI